MPHSTQMPQGASSYRPTMQTSEMLDDLPSTFNLSPLNLYFMLANLLHFQKCQITWVLISLGLFTTYIYPIPGLTLQRIWIICAFLESAELKQYAKETKKGLADRDIDLSITSAFTWLPRFFGRKTGIINIPYVREICWLVIFVGTIWCCMLARPRDIHNMLTALTKILILLAWMAPSASTSDNIHIGVQEAVHYAHAICNFAPYFVGTTMVLMKMIPKSVYPRHTGFDNHRFLFSVGALATAFEVFAFYKLRAGGIAEAYEKSFFLTQIAFYSIANKYFFVLGSFGVEPAVDTKGAPVGYLDKNTHTGLSYLGSTVPDADVDVDTPVTKYDHGPDNLERIMSIQQSNQENIRERDQELFEEIFRERFEGGLRERFEGVLRARFEEILRETFRKFVHDAIRNILQSLLDSPTNPLPTMRPNNEPAGGTSQIQTNTRDHIVETQTTILSLQARPTASLKDNLNMSHSDLAAYERTVPNAHIDIDARETEFVNSLDDLDRLADRSQREFEDRFHRLSQREKIIALRNLRQVNTIITTSLENVSTSINPSFRILR